MVISNGKENKSKGIVVKNNQCQIMRWTDKNHKEQNEKNSNIFN